MSAQTNISTSSNSGPCPIWKLKPNANGDYTLCELQAEPGCKPQYVPINFNIAESEVSKCVANLSRPEISIYSHAQNTTAQ